MIGKIGNVRIEGASRNALSGILVTSDKAPREQPTDVS